MAEEIYEFQSVEFTTNGMVGIRIKNEQGETYNALHVNDLRKILHEDYVTLPKENERKI